MLAAETAASGSAFDSTFAKDQVAAHQAALAAINTELTAGSNTAVKALATSAKPVIASHLSMLQSLVSALSASTGGTASGTPSGAGAASGVAGTTINAGSGGAAATGSGVPSAVIALLAAAGAGLLALGGWAIGRPVGASRPAAR